MITLPIRAIALALFLAFSIAATHGYAQSSICDAAYGGNDSNNGSSWALAKADVMACYDALPPMGGSIYISDDGAKGAGVPTCKASDPPGCGIWIMGSRDPNYSHPPAGWRRAKGAVNFIGVGGSARAAFALGQQVKLAGGANDATHPNIWLSDAYSHRFENLSLLYGHNPIYIGIDSNGSQTNTSISSWNWLFQNVSAGAANTVGYGPTVTIGTNSVWGFFRDCSLGGNAKESISIRSVQRLSQIVTATTVGNLPGSWSSGMSVGIVGVSDATFNGLFHISVTGPNTFTYAQSAENAASAGGMASSDKAQAMILNAGPGNGDGLIFVETTWLSGGGIRAYSGGQGLGLYVRDTWQEDGFAPPVHVIGCPTGLGVRATNIQISDPHTSFAGLRMEGPPCLNSALAETTTVDGPAFLAGSAGPSRVETLPDSVGQSGIYGNRVFAQVDTPRRGFGPVVARYPNLARQNPVVWGTQAPGGSCPASNAGEPAVAPDGTMNAGKISSKTSVVACFHSSRKELAVGDWIIAGAWARSDHANGYARNAAIQVACSACTMSAGTNYVSATVNPGGGGEWDWVWLLALVVASTGSNSLHFMGNVDGTHPASFFAPVLVDIPHGTITANEAAEIALHLQSYREGATAGQVSLLRGEQLKADSIQVGDGPVITSGLGAPTGIASPGSIYLRRDGAPGSTFYIYEKDGWKVEF